MQEVQKAIKEKTAKNAERAKQAADAIAATVFLATEQIKAVKGKYPDAVAKSFMKSVGYFNEAVMYLTAEGKDDEWLDMLEDFKQTILKQQKGLDMIFADLRKDVEATGGKVSINMRVGGKDKDYEK